jgi:tRNA-dihydrouridine synthase 3
MGLGAALARQPNRVRRIVEAMRAVVNVPVTVKIRLGWNATHLNSLDVARAAVEGGAAALTVHGRTREARYRHPADWKAIAQIASSVDVPVVGNGDLLFGHELASRLAASGCTALMTARGALIKPWIFRETSAGYWDISAEERIAIYRRYVQFAAEHWGRLSDQTGKGDAPSNPAAAIDEIGRERVRDFVRWHVGFWVRYTPRRSDGSWPGMQERESFHPRSSLESLLARTDDRALDYITDELMRGGDLARPPEPGDQSTAVEVIEAG